MKDKVVKAARELGLEVDVRTLDQSTRTVAEAAAAVGCSDAQIAKTLVFVADGDPVLVVASGAHRVDTDALADVFDVAEVRQASADEVRVATGYPVGGVSRRGGAPPGGGGGGGGVSSWGPVGGGGGQTTSFWGLVRGLWAERIKA